MYIILYYICINDIRSMSGLETKINELISFKSTEWLADRLGVSRHTVINKHVHRRSEWSESQKEKILTLHERMVQLQNA